MTSRASGTFEVTITPQPHVEAVGDEGIGRMALDKQFSGDLVAASKGQMLASRSDVQGSAGYVALERVRGTLAGKRGSFALQHSGTMTRGAPHLVITVVPDSATDELVGLSGTMAIQISGGKHSYTFDYEFGRET